MYKYSFLFLTVFLAVFYPATAQEFSYKFYGVPDGLAQSQVTHLYQDQKGFLWIVTKGGVSRFDGIRFVNFSRTDGFFVHLVHRIIETKKGEVWFQDEDGLTCWTGSKMVRFQTTLFRDPFALRLFYCSKNDEPTIIDIQPHSRIHIITLRNGKYLERIQFCKGLALNLDPYSQNEILYDSVSDAILISAKYNKLYRYKNGIVDTIQTKNRIIGRLFQGKDGNCYTWADNTFNKISGLDLTLVFISDPLSVSLDTPVAIDRNGVVFYQNPLGKLTVFDHGNTIHDSFRFTTIGCRLIDRENNLWLGTELGLYRLLSRSFINYIPEKCGINPCIWSIAENNRGNLLFASYTDGLQRYDYKSFQPVKGYEKLNKFLDAHFYMGSIIDHTGNVLFARNDIGGVRYNETGFSRIFKKYNLFNTFQFFEDPDNGNLLAGTNIGLIIKSESGEETQVKIHPGGQNLPNVVSIQKDKFDRYWLGGFHGISLYDKGKEIPLPTESMPFSKGGNAMIKDNRGNIWIGNDEGLFLYDYSSFKKIDQPDLHVFVTALALVGDTGLLIGSVNGLGWLDLKAYYSGKIQINHFDKNNGFQGIEVGQNGFFRDSKGYYWIPSSDRVVRFDPRQFKRNNSVPKTYISSISILSDKMKWELLAEKTEWDSAIILKHDQKNIRFSFIGINLSDPEKVLYQFMLDGYDKGWSQPDNTRNAVYTNLPPGNYTFRIKASNENNIWNPEPANLTFRIVPAFWQSWWFWGLCFLVISGTFIYIGFLITSRKRRRLQEKLEREKKLAELHLISLKNQIDPHFTFNAMNAIASVVLKEDKEQAYRFFMKLSALIRAILTSSDKLTRTLGEELDFVSNYLEVEKFRFRDRFEYKLDFDPSLNLDTEVPKMVVQTYVENAIKHGLMHKDGTGHLQVRVFTELQGIRIEVEDDGIGREKAKEFACHSTGKGLYILNGYYDYFRTFRKTDIQCKIIDLFDDQSAPAGTKVEIFIPKNK